MTNSINLGMIRNLCDQAGFSTTISDSGNLVVLNISADEDFKHDVVVIFGVDGEDLVCTAVPLLTIDQHQVGQILVLLNEYNGKNKFIKAYLDANGTIKLERYVFIFEGVSEEHLLTSIKIFPPLVWSFCKECIGNY